MKEFDHLNENLQDEIREERQEIKNIELQGDLYIPRGHTVYFVDLETLIVKRQDYKKEKTLDLTRGEAGIGAIIAGKVAHNPMHIVFTALNDKNALRKVKVHVKETMEDTGLSPDLVKFEK